MKEISNFKISFTNAQFTPQCFRKFAKRIEHKTYRDLTISHNFPPGRKLLKFGRKDDMQAQGKYRMTYMFLNAR